MSSSTNFVQSDFRYDEGKSPLALLAETCRNIGVDTSTTKPAKSSIDHAKSSSTSSSSSSSSLSSSSHESSHRKNTDSNRLSVSPLRIATPVTPISRTSANLVNGSSNGNHTNSSNHNNTNRVNSTSSSSSESYIGTTSNVTHLNGSEPRESSKCSFKPYEDLITNKKKCLEDTRNRSVISINSHSDNNRNNTHSEGKHYSNNTAESGSKSYESNHGKQQRDNVKSSSSHLSNTNHSSSSSSPASTTTTSSSSSSNNHTSTAHNHIKGSNCNGCLPPPSQSHPPSSTPHQSTVDSVVKYVTYPSLSPYLGLPPPPPTGYDPASVAAAAAAAAARMNSAAVVAGHCHSPSMCRDPFCAGCRFSAVAAAANALGQVTCPAGCTQCSHVTPTMSPSMSQLAALQANAYLSGNSFYPPPPLPSHHHHHPSNPPISTSSSVNSSVNSVAAAAAGSNNKPNICNWMIGNTFCGKRFSSSEELHQHLRNHTSSVSELAFLCQYPHLNPIPGFRKSTATFDPINRYHPYKTLPTGNTNGSPLSTLPNGLTGPIPGLTSHTPSPGSQLNMHYPAYGPYVSRLGPPVPP